MTPLSLTAVILSILLLPVNLACAFWMFREALKLCGMTMRDFLDQTQEFRLRTSLGSAQHRGRERRRRYFFLGKFLSRHSADPKSSLRLYRQFSYATLMGLAALLLAEVAAICPDWAAVVLAGDAVLALINAVLWSAGRRYAGNHRLDAQTEEQLEGRRTAQKPSRKHLAVYALVGIFLFLILLGFHVGMSRTEMPPAAAGVDYEQVGEILMARGFDTAGIPTTFWDVDENRLMFVSAGVKGSTKFEFYEYVDASGTEQTFRAACRRLAPESEPEGRSFTVQKDGLTHLLIERDDTMVYAYSSGSMEEVYEMLRAIGYRDEAGIPEKG